MDNDLLKYRPLKRGGDILSLACTTFFFLVVLVISIGKTGSGAYSWQAGFGGAVAGVIGFFFVLNIRKCGDEPFSFREYLKRNVLGYYKVFTWIRISHGSDAETVPNSPLYVERRKLRAFLTDRSDLPVVIAIPYGGWFARPKMVCNKVGRDGWRIATRHAVAGNPDKWGLWLLDGQGSRIACDDQVVVAKIADFLTTGSLGNVMWCLWVFSYDLRDRLRRRERALAIALDTLYNAVKCIEETKRFQYSKEGARIREWLTRELVGLLPESDPRKAELQAKLENLASETAKAGT